MSIPVDQDNDRVLITVIPHTASVRNSRFEVEIQTKFLKLGAFDVQNLITIPQVKLIRQLGRLDFEQLQKIEIVLKNWQGIV